MTSHPICDFPHLYDRGECCGKTPCAFETFWPCEELEGGCPDRSTCMPPWGCMDIRPKERPEAVAGALTTLANAALALVFACGMLVAGGIVGVCLGCAI